MKKINIFLFTVMLMITSATVQAQCDVTANIYPAEICVGEAVTLTSTGGCGFLMANDFNNGTPGAGWVATTGVNFTNPCGTGPDAIYLWMGMAVPIPRTLTTVSFDVDGACEISFWMRYAFQTGASGTNCEGPDLADEGFSLQYSTNGGSSWIDIVYFRPDGVLTPSYPNSTGFTSVGSNQATAFTSWAQYTFAVPPAAQTPNTMFRWRQHVYSGTDFDHWGVDVVEILCPSGTAVEWSHGPTVFNPPQVYPTTDTCYIVTVTDTLYGAGFASDTVCVQVKPVPTATFDVESPICSDLFSNIVYTGDGDQTATYNWFFSGGNVLSGSGQGPYQLTWPFEGWQYVSLEVTQDGCSSGPHYDSVFVNLAPTAIFNGIPTSGCMPLTVQFNDQSSPTPSNWYWSFGDGYTSTQQNPSYTYTDPGTYSVGLIVVTAAGCDDTLMRPNYIEVYGQPVADFYWTPEFGKVYDPVITFYADTSYVTNWFWDFGDGTTSNDPPPVTHQYPSMENTYTVTLIVTNTDGCSDTVTHIVQIIDDILFFPNVITPGNNDGFNDLFVITNADKYPSNYLTVFNRWGKMVYEAKDYANNWDGGDLAEGTYYYIFRYLDQEYHGSLTILRAK
jgi:gliding motility-associated-like protein